MPTLDEHFLALHTPGTPLLMPNAWDPGSAKVLQALGFAAIATTSGGFAATLGRLDGCVTREEALEHAAALVDATTIPVSADLENCFAHDPDDVAETVRLALDAGLAGCSVEDFTRRGYPSNRSSAGQAALHGRLAGARSRDGGLPRVPGAVGGCALGLGLAMRSRYRTGSWPTASSSSR